MIHLVVDNGPSALEAAWAEFQGAQVEMFEMMAAIGEPGAASDEARLQQGMTTVRAWKRFFDLALQADMRRSAGAPSNDHGDTA
jgi:hypothetical protein